MTVNNGFVHSLHMMIHKVREDRAFQNKSFDVNEADHYYKGALWGRDYVRSEEMGPLVTALMTIANPERMSEKYQNWKAVDAYKREAADALELIGIEVER